MFNLDLQPVNLGYTCGGGAARGRLLDRPENVQQISIPEGDAPEERSEPFMDQEDRVQEAEIPRLQYASSGAICWQNETMVDNQVVPWDEQNTLVWEQNFLARCQDAWINPLVQRTEQIGRLVVENHQALEQRV